MPKKKKFQHVPSGIATNILQKEENRHLPQIKNRSLKQKAEVRNQTCKTKTCLEEEFYW